MGKKCCTEPTCLTYLGEGLFQYDTNCGDTKIIATDLVPSPPSTFAYDTNTHVVTHNGVPWQLNCGAFNFDPAECVLSYTNEKGSVVNFPIPQDRFIYNEQACTLQILSAKGESIFMQLGAAITDVGLSLSGKTLSFKYKDLVIPVELPNSVVGCSYDNGTNTLRLIYCDGTFDEKTLAKASLACTTLPDGSTVVNFADGCGGNKAFTIPVVNLDVDNLTVMGSTLTFTYGGDGNDNIVVVDICDIVAANCNSFFTAINPDGSWTYIDNAGNTQTYPAPPNCCTYHTQGAGLLDETAPPGQPANPPAAKDQGDTLVEHYQNGIAWFTCIGGAWVYNFMHTHEDPCCTTLAVASTPINPTQPPSNPENPPVSKANRDTHIECHPNGICAFTCVAGNWLRNWCCVWPQTVVTSVDGTVTITPTTDSNGVTTYDLSVVHPTFPEIPEIPSFCCINPDGSESPILIDAENKVAIPFKDIPVVGSGDVSVNFDGTRYVVSYDAPPGQTIPIYLGKDGNPLVSGDVLLQPEDFANSGVQPPANALLLGFGPDGQCVAYLPPQPTEPPEIPDPCCHYYGSSPAPLGGPPVNPPQVKNDGDTYTQCHPDGISGWTCINGAWVNSMQCPFPAPPVPPEVWIGDSEPDKTAGGGSYKVWFNCNDGCVYYCQEDGTWLAPKGCPVPAPTLPTKEGIFDPETDKLLTEATNPFTDYQCVDGGAEFTRCDGSGVCLVPTNEFKGSSGGTQTVDGTTEYGPLNETLSCHDIVIPKCGPHRVRFEFTIGYGTLGGFQSNASTYFSPQYSINGGATWANYQTGGIDAVVNTGAPHVGDQHGENEFVDYALPLLASGAYTVCSRTVYANGNIISGGINAFASTFRTTWTKMKCCDISATEG